MAPQASIKRFKIEPTKSGKSHSDFDRDSTQSIALSDDMGELERALEGTKFWSYRDYCKRLENSGE
jgi:hypothetical protein